MSKWGGPLAFFVVAALVIWAAWSSTQPDRAEKKRRLSDVEPALAEASRALLAPELPGLTLGMGLQEVLGVRSRLKRRVEADREGLKVFEEPLAEKRSVLYFFGGEQAGIGSLERVQIASNVRGLEAVGERVLDTQKRFGPPTGVWDCPAAGGQLPTRRYSFKHGLASALDVYALVGDDALATFYVSSTRQIRQSIKDANCSPTPPERAHRFPMAVPPAR